MINYGKTENLLGRDPETHSCLGQDVRHAEFLIPKGWLVTEKIDGTNCRLILRRSAPTDMYGALNEPGPPTYDLRGRSDRALLPKGLEAGIVARVTMTPVQHVLDMLECDIICLYGEGYGAGINKGGGDYREDKSFRVFDVVTAMYEVEFGGASVPGPLWYRDWFTVRTVAECLGLATVPVLGEDETIESICDYVANGFASEVASEDDGCGREAEGVVCRTDPYIYDWRGNRVMFKLKTKDLR